MNAGIIALGFVSGVSSPSALSAGDDSAPEASEKRSRWSKGFLGVVKEGLRKGGAILDSFVKKELLKALVSKLPIHMCN